MTMLSFFFLDNTSIAAYPSPRQEAIPGELVPTRSDELPGGQERAGEDPLPLQEPGVSLGGVGSCTAAGSAMNSRRC